MKLFFSFVKSFGRFITQRQLHSFSYNTVIMAEAGSTYNVYIPGDTIPTAETKITLADRISVSPISK